jgi:TRAP-type transport system small permease protein
MPDQGGKIQGLGYWLTRPLEVVAAVLLFALMVMTCIDVVGRYLFNAPLNGATELTRLLMAGIIFAALPAVNLRENHVTVDLLDPFVPSILMRMRQLLINLLSAIILAVISWRVWLLAERAGQYGDRTEFLQIPVAPVVYAIALMCAVAALVTALVCGYYLTDRRQRAPGSSA